LAKHSTKVLITIKVIVVDTNSLLVLTLVLVVGLFYLELLYCQCRLANCSVLWISSH